MSGTKEFLIKLLNSPSVSGREESAANTASDGFKAYCDDVYTDKLGNVIAHKKGQGKFKVMFAAHIDEIGLMVTEYEEGGFLRFAPIGGVDPRALVSQEVTIYGKEPLYGVIGVKPPHITTAAEAKNAHKMEDMAIDTGLSLDRLKEIVKPGDVITINREPMELRNDTLCGRGLDDKAGVAVLYECMKELRNVNSSVDVYYVATVVEEEGPRGALTSAYAIEPDIAIAVDVCMGKTLGVSDERARKLGGGPKLSIGPVTHPKVFELLKTAAKDNFIPYQVSANRSYTNTDADMLQIAGLGACAGLVSVPLRYMHTPVEIISMKDVYATGKLLAAFVRSLDTCELEETLCL